MSLWTESMVPLKDEGTYQTLLLKLQLSGMY